MPSLHAVQAAILSQINTALTGVTVGSPGVAIDVTSAIGWPSVQTLQLNAKGTNAAPTAVVNVYDRKLGRDTTRWLPSIISQTINPIGTESVVSKTNLAPGQSSVITLTSTNQNGSLNVGDAVSAVVQNRSLITFGDSGPSLGLEGPGSLGLESGGGNIALESGITGLNASAGVAIAALGDTPTTLAAKLAAAVNADATLPAWVSAVASGNTVTITNLLPHSILTLSSYTGNTGSQTSEVARRERQFQVVTWAPTEDIREAIGDPIEDMIGNLQNNFGLVFPDGTYGRVKYGSDFDLEDDVFQDTYRRDFLFTIEYGISVTDTLYSVLAPIVQYQLN